MVCSSKINFLSAYGSRHLESFEFKSTLPPDNKTTIKSFKSFPIMKLGNPLAIDQTKFPAVSTTTNSTPPPIAVWGFTTKDITTICSLLQQLVMKSHLISWTRFSRPLTSSTSSIVPLLSSTSFHHPRKWPLSFFRSRPPNRVPQTLETLEYRSSMSRIQFGAVGRR